MAYDIGPRITVAGEKEFNDAIKQINSTLKVLGSELKATASAFDENGASQEQLSATGKTLNAQLTAQQQKFKQQADATQKKLHSPLSMGFQVKRDVGRTKPRCLMILSLELLVTLQLVLPSTRTAVRSTTI